MKRYPESLFGIFFSFTIIMTLFAAWLTHVITCISLSKWGFLIAGAVFAPVGVVHGIGIWFGAW